MTLEGFIFDDEFDDDFDAQYIKSSSCVLHPSIHPSTGKDLQFQYHRKFFFTHSLQLSTLSNSKNGLLASNQSHNFRPSVQCNLFQFSSPFQRIYMYCTIYVFYSITYILSVNFFSIDLSSVSTSIILLFLLLFASDLSVRVI
jgi:hypothetical protein